MMNTRGSWTRAEADNNCAFNSFILALCVAIKNGELKETTPGIQSLLNDIYKDGVIPDNSLARFKEYINTNSPYTIQKRLQGIFRTFAVNAIRSNRDRIENGTIIGQLHEEFRKFVRGKGKVNPSVSTDDDVFTRPSTFPKEYFQFIHDAFEDVYQKNKSAFINKDGADLEKALDAAIGLKDTAKVFESKTFGPAGQQLANWWVEKQSGGSTQFLQKMDENGTWAGDIELSVLADTLSVGLSITRAGEAMGDSVSYGECKVVNQEGIDRLIAVGYLDKNTNKWKKLITETELTDCLSAVPGIEEVKAYISNNNGNLKGCDLSLMSLSPSDQLDMSKLESKLEKKLCLIKIDNDKYQMWGCQEGTWKLTDLGNLKINFTWRPNQTRIISSKDPLFDTLKKGHSQLKTVVVPAEWSIKCKDQLVLRGVLRKDKDVYQFAINTFEDFARLAAVNNQKEVIAAFNANPPRKPALQITLNNNGSHWDNVTEPHPVKDAATKSVANKDSTKAVADKLLGSLSAEEYRKSVEKEYRKVEKASRRKQVSIPPAPARSSREVNYLGESVTEEEQIKRDEKYARQLQQKEFEEHDKSKKLKK